MRVWCSAILPPLRQLKWSFPKIVDHCGVHSVISTSFAHAKRTTQDMWHVACGKATTNNRVDAAVIHYIWWGGAPAVLFVLRERSHLCNVRSQT